MLAVNLDFNFLTPTQFDYKIILNIITMQAQGATMLLETTQIGLIQKQQLSISAHELD